MLHPSPFSTESSPPGRVARPRFAFAAFTLVEVLVTVGLLSFIIFGLLSMFNQTQRAFRSSMTQTDVLEAGRSVMDMIASDLRELRVAVPPEFYGGNSTNFAVETDGGPIYQGLPGTPTLRTNFLDRFFFTSLDNQDWCGIGYVVIPTDTNHAAGALYRYYNRIPKAYGTNLLTATNMAFLSVDFERQATQARLNTILGLPVTNLSRVADGFVELRARPFAPNGFPIVAYNPSLYSSNTAKDPLTYTNAYYRAGPLVNYSRKVPAAAAYRSVDSAAWTDGMYFWSNMAPAAVEIEFGILEPGILKRYRAIENTNVAAQFLSNQVAQVHIFRQRIPVRAGNSSLYP